jgi:uncharacterized protein
LTYPDQYFSIVDRTSFAVMRRLGIERAAPFDPHFAIFALGRTVAGLSPSCTEKPVR